MIAHKANLPAETLRLTRASFVAREAAKDPLHGSALLKVLEGTGLVRAGRPYVALQCRCVAADCPGWAMVHDEPEAREYFERQFERGRPPAKTAP